MDVHFISRTLWCSPSYTQSDRDKRKYLVGLKPQVLSSGPQRGVIQLLLFVLKANQNVVVELIHLVGYSSSSGTFFCYLGISDNVV